MIVYASLQTPRLQDASVNSVATPIPIGFYLIIGRGLAAWYNHATLLKSDWGKKRLTYKIYSDQPPERLSVMHIGQKDPWSRRGDERMGQWPRMLNYFAGIDARDSNYGTKSKKLGLSDDLVNDRNWLKSSDFAKSLEDLEEYVCDHYDFIWRNNNVVGEGSPDYERDPARGPRIEINDGFVGVIEEQDTFDSAALPKEEATRRSEATALDDPKKWKAPGCKYRASVFYKPSGSTKAKFYFVYAYKIDVCAGLGVPRTFTNKEISNKVLFDDHLPKFDELPPQSLDWTKPWIMNGNDYIGLNNDTQKTVIIMKGNAVGAQDVQSALHAPDLIGSVKQVWWLHNACIYPEEPSVDAWVPGCRNNVEIAGTTTDATLWPHGELQVQEMAVNFNEVINSQYNTYREDRETMLAGKLFNLEFHEITKIELSQSEIACTLNFKGSRTNRLYPDEMKLKQHAIASVTKITGGVNKESVGDALEVDKEGFANKIKAYALVYSQGQEFGTKIEGTAAYFLKNLSNWEAASDADTGFPTGIVNKENDAEVTPTTGMIRVLGATALVSARELLTGKHAYDSKFVGKGHFAHISTLPNESTAKDGGGINPALTSIRRANGFKDPKMKVNTAALSELIAAGLSKAAADWIVARRSTTDRGFTIEEYCAQLDPTIKDENFMKAASDDARRQVRSLTFAQLNNAPREVLENISTHDQKTTERLSAHAIDWILTRRISTDLALTVEEMASLFTGGPSYPVFKQNGKADVIRLKEAFTF